MQSPTMLMRLLSLINGRVSQSDISVTTLVSIIRTIMVDNLNSSLASLHYVFNDEQLVKRIRDDAKVLLVGVGGIGCEVIKTMLLIGFTDFTLIDLDTVDISNLNRQFLFNKTHVGQSKAQVAAKVAISRFAHKDLLEKEGRVVNPQFKPIQHEEFGLEEFKKYTMVINALDNRAARSHVNRMCLTAGVPLIESGSEGYLGHTSVIYKGVTQCYDCRGPIPVEETFASCTIRNTPSLPIHCIVWAKHLFAQLFGQSDGDNHVERPSTREWGKAINHDPELLFDKFFKEDIKNLLDMDRLWETRRKPDPLDLQDVLSDRIAVRDSSNSGLRDQRLWSLKECYQVFADSLSNLKNRLKDDQDFLVWDKDDEAALNFVTAVSNFRSHCFNIERKSKFDVKSMAGNIVPAISSTNSIVGGLVALQAVGLLKKDLSRTADERSTMDNDELFKQFNESCHEVYLKKVALPSDPIPTKVIAAMGLSEPNGKCLICSSNIPEVEIELSLMDTKLSDFVEEVVIGKLHFVCPEIQVEGTSCLIYIHEDHVDRSDQSRQTLLSHFSLIRNNTRLEVHDLKQNQTIIVTLKDVPLDPNNDTSWYRLTVVNKGSFSNDE